MVCNLKAAGQGSFAPAEWAVSLSNLRSCVSLMPLLAHVSLTMRFMQACLHAVVPMSPRHPCPSGVSTIADTKDFSKEAT